MAAGPAPGPPSLPWLGTLDAGKRLSQDPLATLKELEAEFGGVVRLNFLGVEVHGVFHPEGLHRVYLQNPGNYTKATHGYSILGLLSGRGLLTSDGPAWKRQRKIATPAFRPPEIRGHAVRFESLSRAHLEGLPEGTRLDLIEEISALTLRIAGKTFLGVDLTGEAREAGRAFSTLFEFLNRRMYQGFPPPLWLPLPSHLRFRRALKKVRGLVDQVLEEIEAGELRSSLLFELSQSRDPEAGAFSRGELLEQGLTLLGAGFETTANSIAWLLVELLQAPEWMARVEAEAEALPQDPEAFLEALHQGGLAQLEASWKEALRLHPPLWAYSRRVLEDDVLEGFLIPKGGELILSAYATHHSEKLWDQPESFRPERFLEPEPSGPERLRFVPFGAGPRQCIGMEFARVEVLVLVGRLLQGFQIQPIEPVVGREETTITLRPSGGLGVRLRRKG